MYCLSFFGSKEYQLLVTNVLWFCIKLSRCVEFMCVVVFDCVWNLADQVQRRQPVREMPPQLGHSGPGAWAQRNSALIVQLHLNQ